MEFIHESRHEASDHLSPAALRSPGGVDREHCTVCRECAHLAEAVASMRVSDERGASGSCIPPERMARLCGEGAKWSRAELRHVSTCERCSLALQACGEEPSPQDAEAVGSSASASAAWQRRMALEVASQPVRHRFGPRNWWWLAPLATACVLVLVAVVAVPRLRPAPETLLARAYEKQRLTPLRLIPTRHAELAVTRGPSLNPPSELLKARARAREQLEQAQNDAYWTSIDGSSRLLQGQFEDAIDAYRVARALDGKNPRYLFELGTAECAAAIHDRNAHLFVRGINDLQEYARQRPDDELAQFNLGKCLEGSGALHEAQKHLRNALAGERDSGWRQEIEHDLREIQQELDAGRGANSRSQGRAPQSGAEQLLVAAAERNRLGYADEALELARSAEREARAVRDGTVMQRALFEQVYALQRQSRAADCLRLADRALVSLPLSPGLRVRFLTEKGNCSSLLGGYAAAESALLQAISDAAPEVEPNVSLRAVGMLAGLYNDMGRYVESEELDIRGLRESLRFPSEPMRRYQFLSDLYFNSAYQGYRDAAEVFEREALRYASETQNIAIRAAAHEKLAEACLRTGDGACSDSERSLAWREIAFLEDRRQRALMEADWRLQQARLELDRGRTDAAQAALAGVEPQAIGQNTPLLTEHWLLEARLARAAGWSRAEPFALGAATLVLRSYRLLRGSADRVRFEWIRSARPVFEELVRIQLSQGRDDRAWECWESFNALQAGIVTSPCSRFPRGRLAGGRLVAYVGLGDRYGAFTVDAGTVHWHALPSTAEETGELAAVFQQLCSEPRRLDQLESVGGRLARVVALDTLAGDESAPVAIEPDGALARLPWRALPWRGTVFGLGRRVVVVPGAWSVRDASGLSFAGSTLLEGPAEFSGEEIETVAGLLGGRARLRRVKNLSAAAEEFRHGEFVYYSGHASAAEAEQVGLRLTSPLKNRPWIVLAACATGAQDLGAGEPGFATLPIRLLQLGARTVVASRWDVDSGATATLMEGLVRNASAGGDPAEALRLASVQVYRDGHRHPYYWAAFDVYGR